MCIHVHVRQVMDATQHQYKAEEELRKARRRFENESQPMMARIEELQAQLKLAQSRAAKAEVKSMQCDAAPPP